VAETGKEVDFGRFQMSPEFGMETVIKLALANESCIVIGGQNTAMRLRL
jgi:hypothetical protein